MTTYAITGATGHFGQAALKVLTTLVPNDSIIALARNVQKAQAQVPAGVSVRAFDYDRPEQLATALSGVDKLLFVSSQPGGPVTRLDQHRQVVAAAKAAGVGFMAYTSFPHADTNDMPLAADHRATEALIQESGIAHAFLRNNWYLENEAATLRHAAAGKPFVYAAGSGQAGWALEREYAEAAAKVLVAAAPEEVYELAGPARTYADLAAATPGTFEIKQVSDADYAAGLEKAGLPKPVAELLTGFQTLIRQGALQPDGNDLPTLLGHPLTPLAEAIKEVLG